MSDAERAPRQRSRSSNATGPPAARCQAFRRPMKRCLKTCWLVLALCVGAACSSMPPATRSDASIGARTAGPTPSSGPASIVDPTPAQPTPRSVVDALIAAIRSPSLRFHLEGIAHFVLGAHTIDYLSSVDVSGPDRSTKLTESFDGGQGIEIDSRYVGGVLYSLTKSGLWAADASPNATIFGGISYRLQSTLVLGDLGAVTVGDKPAYRLRVASGIDLYPPQFQDGTVASPHDPQGRLELTVGPDGLPLSAHETRSLAGTIGGVPSTATGVYDLTFSQIGSAPAPVAPNLPSGVPVPTAQPAPSPIPATWTRTTGDGFSLAFPEVPTESTGSTQSIRVNANLTVHSRVVTYPSGLRFAEQDAVYPAAYVASHPVGEQLVATRDGGVADLQGQLVGSLDTTVQNLPALNYFIARPNEIYRVQIFLLGDRLVLMSVIGSVLEVGSPAADQFLGSIQLTQ